MAYIITSKTRRNKGRKFPEHYLKPGGIEQAEKDGYTKSEIFQEINHLTDKGVTVDQRREIVNSFVDRSKAK